MQKKRLAGGGEMEWRTDLLYRRLQRDAKDAIARESINSKEGKRVDIVEYTEKR